VHLTFLSRVPELKVGAMPAWLRLEPGNLKTFPNPLRPMRVAAEALQG
jgi:hypothetical protein